MSRMFFNLDNGISVIDNTEAKILIVGFGSVGSTVFEFLVKNGFSKFHLIEFDYLQEHNITASTLFTKKHLLQNKLNCSDDLKELYDLDIVKLDVDAMKYKIDQEFDYIFLFTDSLSSRIAFLRNNYHLFSDKTIVIDIRIGTIKDAEVYIVDKSKILSLVNFSVVRPYKNIEEFLTDKIYLHRIVKIKQVSCGLKISLNIVATTSLFVVNALSFPENLKEQVTNRLTLFDISELNQVIGYRDL